MGVEEGTGTRGIQSINKQRVPDPLKPIIQRPGPAECELCHTPFGEPDGGSDYPMCPGYRACSWPLPKSTWLDSMRFSAPGSLEAIRQMKT